MRNYIVAGIGILISAMVLSGCKKMTEGPYFATGIKIGEVTNQNATIWIRLTKDSLPKGPDNPLPDIRYKDTSSGDLVNEISGDRNTFSPLVSYPEGYDVSTLQGATTGSEGDVMVYYKPENSMGWEHSDWISVDTARDFTTQIVLTGLIPNSVYDLRIIARYPDSMSMGGSINGTFKTAPAKDAIDDILFAVSTGQAYVDQDAAEGGYKIYPVMLKLGIDFFVHTGDILYYDKLAKNKTLARWHWSRMFSLPTNFQFYKNVSCYFMKDDHDTWLDDCWPGYRSHFMGDFTFEQGQAIFLEQVPMQEKTYRTFRWGKDLQIWLMEGRDFRSPNTDPDGPDKTIWGKEQKAWLFKTVKASDASFKILISPTPIVGPDRENKNDNHANRGFAFEGNEIRHFIAEQGNMYVVCGDRHWQYVSEDEETGVREYSCGPASNEHAGGWSNDMIRPTHRYLNVTGGFLAVRSFRSDDIPLLIMTHYSVEGKILNSDTLTVQ